MTKFDDGRLSDEDFETYLKFTHGRSPDLVIAPDGTDYLYRWYLTPHELKDMGQSYFHVQVASDPERPLHDHPWDNMSTILSGGYDELWDPTPWLERNAPYSVTTRKLRQKDVVFRRAAEAHRLILPKDIPYTMTLFSVGPHVRKWGFWYPEGWTPFDQVTVVEDGVSRHVKS